MFAVTISCLGAPRLVPGAACGIGAFGARVARWFGPACEHRLEHILLRTPIDRTATPVDVSNALPSIARQPSITQKKMGRAFRRRTTRALPRTALSRYVAARARAGRRGPARCSTRSAPRARRRRRRRRRHRAPRRRRRTRRTPAAGAAGARRREASPPPLAARRPPPRRGARLIAGRRCNQCPDSCILLLLNAGPPPRTAGAPHPKSALQPVSKFLYYTTPKCWTSAAHRGRASPQVGAATSVQISVFYYT